MAKLLWILLLVLAIDLLVDSAITTSTTRKPRARKAPLRKTITPSNSTSSSKAVRPSSTIKKVQPITKSNSTSSAGASVRSLPSRWAQNATFNVRRNPASLELPEISPTRVDPSRIREDMEALGVNNEFNPDNNVNAMETPTIIRPSAQSRPSFRPPVQSRLPSRTSSRFNNFQNSAFDPFDEYEDLLFDDYDQPLEDNKLLAETSSSGKFLKSEVCGRKYFCQRGNRGPCHRNEVFLPQTDDFKFTATRPSCTNLISYPWNGCMAAGKVGVAASSSAASGSCAIRFPQRPCYGYPLNYRFWDRTKRCYPTSNGWQSDAFASGPCPLNKMFIDVDGINGMCQCRDRNQLLFRNDDRCHRIYAKGPCDHGQWLEPDTNGYGVCRPSPCPENKCDGRHIYWKPTPISEGGCYKSFTRGPCRKGSYFLVEDYGTRRGRCMSQYGSSFSPFSTYSLPARHPVMRNPYDMMYTNNYMSPWSKFGMYPPPFDMMQDYDDSPPQEDYDDLADFDY